MAVEECAQEVLASKIFSVCSKCMKILILAHCSAGILT
jgi:hypothetical protein